MPARFLQIHTLTSYPAVLLNRDDAGFAKQLPFGSAIRTRISSQCLKRHWRTYDGEHALVSLGSASDLAIRSREIIERMIAPEIAKAHSQDVVEATVDWIKGAFFKAKKGNGNSDEDAEEEEGTSEQETDNKKSKQKQVVVLGPKEIIFITKEALALANELKTAKAISKPDKEGKKAMNARLKGIKKLWSAERLKNIGVLGLGAGLDAAVFGRMVTSDILARCDAAVHVAHAFTVHGAQTEADYFSAVDDLTSDDGELGAGHINSTDLTSGLYYSYVAIDVPLLVANLTGCDLRQDKDAWKKADRTLASQVVESLVHTIATVSPGAKLGSTAPHSYAHLMLVESGDAQPCTLANAFIEPLPTKGDLIGSSYEALAQELLDLDSNYPRGLKRAHLARGRQDSRYDRLLALKKTVKDGDRERVLADPGERQDIVGLAAWAAQQVAV